MKITVKMDGQSYDVEVGDLYSRPVTATIAGETFEVWPEGEAPYQVKPTLKTAAALPVAHDKKFKGMATNSVMAPIPGVIFQVNVGVGQEVTQGQTLCVLEAMKMKNVIRSPKDGQILAVAVENGQQVMEGDLLVQFE
jgi:glutaconyl-CoA/methylmalonyl-CoA decarboxylase subunit gamma